MLSYKKVSTTREDSGINQGLNHPYAIAIGLKILIALPLIKAGNIYVGYLVGGTNTKGTPAGEKTEVANGFSYPTGLAIDANGAM